MVTDVAEIPPSYNHRGCAWTPATTQTEDISRRPRKDIWDMRDDLAQWTMSDTALHTQLVVDVTFKRPGPPFQESGFPG